MRSIIKQSVLLPAPAEKLYSMYLDPAAHAGFTGHPVTITAERGAPFQAFGGMISGTILEVVAPRLIVQSWRSLHFGENDPDSTLILSFAPEGDQGRIDMIHLDVPECDFKGVTEGWGTHYWEPWRKYLAQGK